MQHLDISRALWRDFGVSDEKILSGKIEKADLAGMLESVRRNHVLEKYEGRHGDRFFFPDVLYDSSWKRNARAQKSRNLVKLVDLAENHGLVLHKYRQFMPYDTLNSLYSPTTIETAKAQESVLLGNFPRIGKIERTYGKNGLFHIQGLVALPDGQVHPPDNFQPLDYSEVGAGARQFAAYLSKPADQNVERRPDGRLLHPLELALGSVADWYVGSVENRSVGRSRNPRTRWQQGIPSRLGTD